VFRRQFLVSTASVTGALALPLVGPGWAAALADAPRTAAGATRFDLNTGNAGIEVVIPEAIKAIFETMSPDGNDAPTVLRVTTMLTQAWFDAIAPYHRSAVGVSSRLGRRPAAEATTRSRNIAILAATEPVVTSLFPARAPHWRQLVRRALPGALSGTDRVAVRMGVRAGRAVVADRVSDGMNQLGDERRRRYNPMPYGDWTDYAPVNSADELRDPGRWQPLVVSDRLGVYRSQRFITPQLGRTRPYSYRSPRRFHVPEPLQSVWHRHGDNHAYRRQADQVLEFSARLTDAQKMTAETYDNKIAGLGFSALFAAQSRGLDVAGFVEYDFATNLASFDTAIAVWHLKRHYDAVRPTTAIRHLYGDAGVTAWGGPGRGTVSDLPANQWRSYLDTADHPEYPSASTALCNAHAEVSRRYSGTEDLGWQIQVAQGSSGREPGVTPTTDITLRWNTWSQLAQDCGLSRVWGGVHFLPSVTSGAQLGRQVGGVVADFIEAHLSGHAPLPAHGRH